MPNQKLPQAMIESHLDWLKAVDSRDPLPMSGAEVGSGWHGILTRLLDELAGILRPIEGQMTIRRIKEKFGTLRFYWAGNLDRDTARRVADAIRHAEFRSGCTCETCGNRGLLVNDDEWLSTRCELHRSASALTISGNGPVVSYGFDAGTEKFEEIRYDPETDTVETRPLSRAEYDTLRKSR